MHHLKILFLAIISGASLGTSQFLISLTRNREIICAGEEVQYTCTADAQTVYVEWIVEPFIDGEPVEPVGRISIFLILAHNPNPSAVDFVVTFNASSSPDIIRHLICSDDNCQNVTKSSGVILAMSRCPVNFTTCNVSVRAVNRCGRESPVVTQTFIGPVQSPSNLELLEADDDSSFFLSRIFGTFTPSSTPNISQYMVNCTDAGAACDGAVVNGTENSFILNVRSSCTGITYSISVRAVDIDGRMSQAVIGSMTTKEYSEPVEPVGRISVFLIVVDDPSAVDFVVTFNASSSPDIVRYLICSADNCQNVTKSSGMILAISRCPVNFTTCNVSVRAVNRCGRESPAVTQTVIESQLMRFIGHIQSPSNLELVEADDDSSFFSSRIFGAFTPSSTPNISQYMVNCTDAGAACDGAVVSRRENSFILNVRSSCTGITYSISVRAVDIDGRMSQAVTESVTTKEYSGYCVVTSLFTVIIVVLAIVVGVLGCIILSKKCKAGDDGKQMSDNKTVDKGEQETSMNIYSQ